MSARRDPTGTEIAIVGMAGRFPGARDLTELWRNLRSGSEAVRFPTPEEMRARGLDAARLADPGYVKAVSQMDDYDCFDDLFFGVNPREAELMDPQQRLLLECAWEALERRRLRSAADRRPGRRVGRRDALTYLLFNLVGNPLAAGADPLQVVHRQRPPTSLATRISYKLNLRGPSHSVQCACSTSLVAVHGRLSGAAQRASATWRSPAACRSRPTPVSATYVPGAVTSPDGHCRAFDAAAEGSIFGRGGVVVLKRLADALADRDTVRAVILGSAVNNDGSLKVGFTAPSVGARRR
jgi:acyl transferase domain-containing protein